jgi:hypothetical protein
VVSVMLLVAGHDHRLRYLRSNLDRSSFLSAEAPAARLSQLRIRGQQCAI